MKHLHTVIVQHPCRIWERLHKSTHLLSLCLYSNTLQMNIWGHFLFVLLYCMQQSFMLGFWALTGVLSFARRRISHLVLHYFTFIFNTKYELLSGCIFEMVVCYLTTTGELHTVVLESGWEGSLKKNLLIYLQA